jgi:hypothetical protein
MARKIYVDLSDHIDAWREKTNIMSDYMGDLDNLVVPNPDDSDLVSAINWVYDNAIGRGNVELRLINSEGTIIKTVYGFESSA